MNQEAQELQQEPCPRCKKLHAAGKYVARPDLREEGKGMPYNAPDVTCSCGAVLRCSVPLFKVNASGWVWRIV